MNKFLTICCLSLLLAGCNNTLDEYPSAAEENTALSRTVTESAAVTKKIEVSPAYQGNCLLVLSNYADQIQEQLGTTAEALVAGVEDGSIELSPLNASEEPFAVPTLDSEKGALEVTLPQELSVGTRLQTGVVFHKKGETEGLQFVFDISVVEFNENNATAMNFTTRNRANSNNELPDVLLSCLRMCENLCGISAAKTGVSVAKTLVSVAETRGMGALSKAVEVPISSNSLYSLILTLFLAVAAAYRRWIPTAVITFCLTRDSSNSPISAQVRMIFEARSIADIPFFLYQLSPTCRITFTAASVTERLI